LAIKGSIYDPDHFRWEIPTPIVKYAHQFGRPELDWEGLKNEIKLHGIRNSCQTTIAPTGTIATVAGCEGYGCEPVFALAYIRHVNDHGRDLQLTYASPQFEKALNEAGLDEATRERVIDQVRVNGTCQGIAEIPEAIRRVFVVSADITAEEHVRMQAALQAFVDNSLSKTINFPETAGVEDVARAYRLAWKLNCKGITVYVTGSRQKVVLETNATAQAKEQPVSSVPANQDILTSEPGRPLVQSETVDQLPIWHEKKKPRPRSLHGITYSISTPLGEAFVTINVNGGNQPFEVFINTAKAGSDTAAVSEAIGRLISYILRLASPVEPRERLKEVWRQLSGIGGGRSLGFGPNRVRSLPDGVAQILAEYLQENQSDQLDDREISAIEGGNGFHVLSESGLERHTSEVPSAPLPLKIGDLCPECGHASVVNEEGCRKCYSCGYSEC
jgi:ribonucleoside-diphosphate reductase alpha chain